MESATNCDINSDYPSKMSVDVSNRDLITIDRNLFYNLEGDARNVTDEIADLPDGRSLGTLQNIPILDAQNIEYLPPDVQNCVEINSSDVMNIPENQILQIHYQTENGIVNAEYIVDDQILQMQMRPDSSSFVELKQENIFNSSCFHSEVSQRCFIQIFKGIIKEICYTKVMITKDY